jgi:hypothetical protein
MQEEPTGLYDYLPRTIRRTGYTTRRGVRVKSSRVRDMGAPGKWRRMHYGAPGIGKLKTGLLKKVGYDVSSSRTRRHSAVNKAVKKYGKASTIRKLNAVSVYTRRTSPKKSRTFRSDMKYVQTKYS